jgi:nucleoid DNA-binding protein
MAKTEEQKQLEREDEVLRQAADIIKGRLKGDGDELKIRGLGAFRCHTRGPTTRRNPQTGDPVQVGEKKAIHFKPSTAWVKGLNE